MPARLTPLEPPTADALVTGDPRRAFALALELTDQPKMSHQARGLWGYTGVTAGGLPLTVQSTGVGGPSAVAVLADLAELGVKRVIRLGTCVAPASAHPAGQALLIECAIGCDGASARLSDSERIQFPDSGLQEALAGVAPPATVSSHDFVTRHDPSGPRPDEEASARDLQTAACFAICRRLGLEAAAVLVVTGEGDERDLAETELNELLAGVGRRVVNRLEKLEPKPRLEG